MRCFVCGSKAGFDCWMVMTILACMAGMIAYMIGIYWGLQ